MSKQIKPSIVFVHGIWADGSSFSKVIPTGGGARSDCRPVERFVAKRMGATTYEADSSHVAMLSKPDLVIDVIRAAAKGVTLTQRIADRVEVT
jgi:hypothetical protein